MHDPLERVYQRLLVLRCQTGDEAAFAELVTRYHTRLRSFLRQMLGDADTADDALQEAWFDVFRGIGRLRDAGAFEAWAFRIARDRAYRVLRRKGLPVLPIRSAEEAIADPAAATDDAALAAETVEEVRGAVGRLPHEQREVLLLRFVEQLSYEQIAAAVGCAVGTVRSRLHYAKDALRREMERNRT